MIDRKEAFDDAIRALMVLDRDFSGEGGSDADRIICHAIKGISEVRDNANEFGYLPRPARTRCSVGFEHPPHDFCDGNPGAKFGQPRNTK